MDCGNECECVLARGERVVPQGNLIRTLQMVPLWYISSARFAVSSMLTVGDGSRGNLECCFYARGAT